MKRLLRALILLFVRILAAPRAFKTTQRVHKQQGPVSQPKILLIRPDHLGDLVLTTPVFQVLREHIPNAQITMLVGPWSSEVVARHPALDFVIACPFPGFQRSTQRALAPYTLLFSTAQQLRRSHYDLAINLRPDFWWGAALIYLAGIPRRIGYAIQPGTPFLTQPLAFPLAEHATLSSLRLVSAALQSLHYPALAEPFTPAHYPLSFTPTAEERSWVNQRLQEVGITEDQSFVVIHPGTGGAVKLWRTAAWTSLANQLSTTDTLLSTPVQIILTGGKHERPMLEEIAVGITSVPVLITDATVGQLAALLARAQFVLGVDNGPLHLATSQDTPTIRLYGPTDPHIFGPWGSSERHIVIASTQRCPDCPFIPCGRLDFRPEELPAHPCVRLIPGQRVEQAIISLPL